MEKPILNTLTDNELFDLVSRNKEEAFTMLYERYWKRMLYKALLKLPSESDAEEVVQDTFIDLWNSRHRIQIKHTFHTYIASVVRYKIMAKMAANKKQTYQDIEGIESKHILDHSTEEWISFNDLRDEIEAAVKTLPEKCQLVFRMSREEGMSHKEIAEELDLSSKSVEAHITRAIKTLRKKIGPFLFSLLL